MSTGFSGTIDGAQVFVRRGRGCVVGRSVSYFGNFSESALTRTVRLSHHGRLTNDNRG